MDDEVKKEVAADMKRIRHNRSKRNEREKI